MNITFSFVCKNFNVDFWTIFVAFVTFAGTIVALIGVFFNSRALKKQSDYQLLDKRLELYVYFKNHLFEGKPADIEHISYLKFLFSFDIFNKYFKLKNYVEEESKITEIYEMKRALIMSIAKKDISKALSIDVEFMGILRDGSSVPQFADFRKSCRDSYGNEIMESEFGQFKELFEKYLASKEAFDKVEDEIHDWLTSMHDEIYKGIRVK